MAHLRRTSALNPSPVQGPLRTLVGREITSRFDPKRQLGPLSFDLTDEERAALVGMLTTEIEQSRYPLSPRIVMMEFASHGWMVWLAGSPTI